MSKTTKNSVNDWQTLAAKPEVQGKKKYDDKIVEPYKIKREGAYLSMYPSDEGETYCFSIIPDSKGNPFIMTDVMTIKRFKFKNPKTGEDYFENLKIPMDPKYLFDMSIVDKAASNPGDLTEEDKKVLSDIKVHSDLVRRYKQLFYTKDVEGINFGYSPAPTRYNNRLRKEALTGFFGVPTKWKGSEVSKPEVKFIQTRYSQFQDKFRSLLSQTAETHDELMPTWYEDFFTNVNGFKGVIDVKMGSMKVGGAGATVKLVKLGKDPIEDKGVGVGPKGINSKVALPKGEENAMSHLHYYMGFKTNESLWQDMYVDRFKEAIEDLENHLKEVKAKNSLEGTSGTVSNGEDLGKSVSQKLSDGSQDDLPF